MKCQICNEVEAVININGNVNGVESSLYLCHDCAEENDIGPEVLRSLDKSNFLEKYQRISELMDIVGQTCDLECESCACTVSQFNATGRLGCPDCYDQLFPYVLEYLAEHDMTDLHRGAAPEMILPDALELALNNEDYEQAIIIRDMMKNPDTDK